MKQKTKAKGISLIVLVITIIIIIILAGAVILSLSNSNVINKAKSGIMQTDMATVKEQIKTKMAENELNNINTKIGTQLWDSYYTMSVSQLQEIGITTKSDYIYDYNTGNLSVKQNNEYVTSEELYPTDPQGAYIEGYMGINGLATTTSKQTLINSYTNGGIKVMLISKTEDVLDEIFIDETKLANFAKSIETPIYETKTNNSGYFRLENITPGNYTIVITDDVNTLAFVRNITIAANQAKVISTKTTPIKLYLGDIIYREYPAMDGSDLRIFTDNSIGSGDIRKYDVNRDGIINNVDITIVSTSMVDYTIYDTITI